MRTTFLGIVMIMLLAGMSVAAFEMQENRTFEAFGNTWEVGYPPDPFSSIQEAVYNDSVMDGDTLHVKWREPWYLEYVHVNKTLKIMHHPGEFPESYPTVLGFNVCAPGVEISEFTVRSDITLSANSSNAVIRNNNLTQYAYDGIYISAGSYNNTLAQNNVSRLAIESTGDIEHFIQNVSESNRIDGKPICYLVNESDKRIRADAGFVAIVNSENITVEDLFSLRSNEDGVLIVNSTDVNVTNVAFKSHIWAVEVRDSSRITVRNHKFQSPYSVSSGVVFVNANDSSIQNITFDLDVVSYQAVGLYNSWNNTIKENTGVSLKGPSVLAMVLLHCSHDNVVQDNTMRNENVEARHGAGVYVGNSCNNTIVDNNVTNAYAAVALDSSHGNLFFHNNLVTNDVDVMGDVDSVDNSFDNGLEGNYWSAYSGPDADGDGIGDTDYVTGRWTDYCPLMLNWSENRVYERPMKVKPPDSGWIQKLYTFSNSTLGSPPIGFTFNKESGEIALKVTCGYDGFLSITIPRNWTDMPFNVSVDDDLPDYALTLVNSTYSSTYITFAKGNHTVTITGLEVGSITGDLNADHIVDILDAIILANNFNAEEDP